VLPIIRHHHEKRDGSGYPDGRSGEEIPLAARILQLADVYDALTTNRPYRTAVPSDEALQIMDDEAKLGWWDQELFNKFRDMIRDGRTASNPEDVRGVAK
jgi:putative two-component system response regulator